VIHVSNADPERIFPMLKKNAQNLPLRIVGRAGGISPTPQQFPEVNRYVFHHFATENKIYLI
jgi:hypothetical protein